MCDRDVTCSSDDYTSKLMAEVDRLQAENERLQAENADLREEIGDWHGRAFAFKSACESLIDGLCKLHL
jgi:FtsZ-binding cell division protein ZapB